VEKQLEKAEVLLRLTEGCLVPTGEKLMQAEEHLRSAKEHLEAVETRLAPAEAPPISTDEAVVGALDAGEPVRGPPKGKAWSLQKRAWCIPGEAGGQRERHQRPQNQGCNNTASCRYRGRGDGNMLPGQARQPSRLSKGDGGQAQE
jgi:hypothetical protein